MVQVSDIIREKIRRFAQKVRLVYPVEKTLLYGSYAKGNPSPDSDIDVAVVVDIKDHLKRVTITSQLLHLAGQIDPAIEPKCVFSDEYKNCDRASILFEILSTAIEIN